MNTLGIAENTIMPPVSGRMAGDERRQQILEIAVKLFSEKGFRGTTTKEIALAAGVSEAMVFRHFANKQELYTAILEDRCHDDLTSPIDDIKPLMEAEDDYGVFFGLASHALEKHEEDRDFMRLLLYSALEGHELAEMFFERFIVEIYEVLGSYIADRQRAGAFRQIEPRIVVRAFVGMMIHHSLNNTLWDKSARLLKISNEDAARNFTEILLGGIRKK